MFVVCGLHLYAQQHLHGSTPMAFHVEPDHNIWSVSAACLHLYGMTLACRLQAGMEDNPPVYVLGGNIVPLGASGLMTTTALRASNLTLLAAFPAPGSPPFERCGKRCTVQSTAKHLVTCGHMYMDQGTPHAFSPAQYTRRVFMPGVACACIQSACVMQPLATIQPSAMHEHPARMSSQLQVCSLPDG